MTKRIARMGLLTALALVIYTIEAQIPSLVPIPGVKLGLANIITVYAIFCVGPKDTLFILLSRIFLGSIFSGNMMTFLYSFAGGMLCYLIMLLIHKFLSEKQIWVCSVLGAIGHNIGQIVVAIWITKTWQILFYLPVLLISGVITGLITGLAAQFTISRLKHIIK